MKRFHYIIFISLFFFTNNTQAQNAAFLSQGRIEFERKINLWAQIDDEDDAGWKDLMKKSRPQFKSSYFDLLFIQGKTLYRPGRENTDNNKLWQEPAEDNIVYTDLTDSLSVSEKNVFDQAFLIHDSTRKIKWKITDEKRTIAGFDCRRANAIIMDSIYVVAFYTDQIPVTGGPESFSGLPGIILGVALPHEHITWFATKVYTDKIADTELVPPAKGKKITDTALLATLKDVFKDWQNWGNIFTKQTMY
jgi:GLPGLI family protein